jgi:hypothetical protein
VDFVAVVDQVIALLRQRGRVSSRTLQIQFTLDDEQLATLKDELLYSQPQVVDDAGRGGTSALGRSSCPPCNAVPSSPRAMPSLARLPMAMPWGTKGSGSPRQLITPRVS